MGRLLVVLLFAVLQVGCSKPNKAVDSGEVYTKVATPNSESDAWVKVKYDIDESSRVKNIEFVDSDNSNQEFERAIINNMSKWKFEGKDKNSQHTTTILFRKELVSKEKK
ncbi:hypothetical protein M2263_001095 [Providencia alcalifaciens]|nr:hypothetical protein [Providencia alcalifaciens]